MKTVRGFLEFRPFMMCSAEPSNLYSEAPEVRDYDFKLYGKFSQNIVNGFCRSHNSFQTKIEATKVHNQTIFDKSFANSEPAIMP